MTVLTKPSIIIKKQPDVTKSPLVHENICDEEKIEVHPSVPEWTPPKRSSGALLWLSVTAMLVAITGITSGLMLYRQYLRSTTVHRFQGFCSIPIDMKEESQVIDRMMPLQWTSDPDVQIFSASEPAGDKFVSALREELDIGDTIEKISVFDNGHRINFIHDFGANVTGIVDQERCFVMELDSELVLAPELLAGGLQRGERFDVTRVRSTLHAVLPALRDLARLTRALADTCRQRPTYRLQRDHGLVIRKRSVDDPAPNYMQFSGKHVQEIEIDNMAELLEYEKKQA